MAILHLDGQWHSTGRVSPPAFHERGPLGSWMRLGDVRSQRFIKKKHGARRHRETQDFFNSYNIMGNLCGKCFDSVIRNEDVTF